MKCLRNFNWQRNRVHSIAVQKNDKGTSLTEASETHTREVSCLSIEVDFLSVLCFSLAPLIWQMFQLTNSAFPSFFPLEFARVITFQNTGYKYNSNVYIFNDRLTLYRVFISLGLTEKLIGAFWIIYITYQEKTTIVLT